MWMYTCLKAPLQLLLAPKCNWIYHLTLLRIRFNNTQITTLFPAYVLLDGPHRFADYVPGSDIRLDNPFKHGVSAALLLLDLALSRMPLVSYHIQVTLYELATA